MKTMNEKSPGGKCSSSSAQLLVRFTGINQNLQSTPKTDELENVLKIWAITFPPRFHQNAKMTEPNGANGLGGIGGHGLPSPILTCGACFECI